MAATMLDDESPFPTVRKNSAAITSSITGVATGGDDLMGDGHGPSPGTAVTGGAPEHPTRQSPSPPQASAASAVTLADDAAPPNASSVTTPAPAQSARPKSGGCSLFGMDEGTYRMWRPVQEQTDLD